jgi:CDP-diglyceride synthetase
MLSTRLISAGILAPIVVVVTLLGEPWLSTVVGLLIFLAMVELISLLDAGGFSPPQVVALAASIVVGGAGLIAAAAAHRRRVGDVRATGCRASLVAHAGAVVLLGMAGFTVATRVRVLGRHSSFGVAYVALLAPIVAVAHLSPAGGTRTTPIGALHLGPGPHGCSLLWWCGATTQAPISPGDGWGGGG